MAVSPLAPQGFKAPNRSGRRLPALNLTTSGVVMDQDWNETASWHRAKEKSLRGCLRTVGPKTGMLNRLAAHGVWRPPGDLALIKVRLQRREQLSGCVYMCCVNPALGNTFVLVVFNLHFDSQQLSVRVSPLKCPQMLLMFETGPQRCAQTWWLLLTSRNPDWSCI